MSERLDAVLRVATVGDVFRLAGLEAPNDPKKLLCCPLPGHADGTPSFHVQASLKGYRCFGCDSMGGVLELAVALGIAATRGEALDILADLHRIPKDSPADFVRRPRATAAVVLLPPEKRESALSSEKREELLQALERRVGLLTSEGAPGAAYMLSRGIERAAADVCRVRFHPDWIGCGPAVVFPVVDERGRVIGAQGRYLDPNATPKARSLGPIGNGVYATAGALETQNAVGITEAPIDALSLALCGLPALALLGCGLKPWLRRALKFRRVLVATDADAAGNKAADELFRVLDLSDCERFTFPSGYKDANDYLRADALGLDACVQALLNGEAPTCAPGAAVISLDEHRSRREAQESPQIPLAVSREALA